MIQNIKADIIYYQMNTDFEMEFNLCGCCRMRLLTDKAPDRQTLIHCLARAVSRSRVILLCGPLFGDTGLIPTVASAIGTTVSNVDKEAFHIQSEGDIPVLSGSTPLVTEDGVFGGCVIESGPQSIILLTESKTVRKPLMSALIHPYIAELSITPPAPAAPVAPVAPVVTVPEITPAVPAEESAPVPEAEQTPAEELPAEPTAEELNVEEATAEEAAETEETPAEEPVEAAETEEPVDETAPAAEEPAAEEAVAEETPAPEETVPAKDVPEEKTAEAPAQEQPIPEEPTDIFSGRRDEPAADPAVIPMTDDGFILFDPSEPVAVPRRKRRSDNSGYYGDDYQPSESDALFIAGDDSPLPGPRHDPLKTAVIVLSAILLAVIALLAYLLVYTPMHDGIPVSEYLQGLFSGAKQAAVISARLFP